MRFAVALLAVVGIVAGIGTVVPQGEGLGTYINKFGQFWGVLFVRLGLGQVYSAWWFLLILALLVASTALCLVRHTPKHWADMRSMKEHIRPRALRAFGLHAQARLAATPQDAAQRLAAALAARRWRVRPQVREGEGVMLAARAGASNRLGYVLAHGAIVLIALGGLLDGEMFTRAAMLLGGKSVYTGGGQVAKVPAEHRLPAGNPAFRGHMLVAEGERSATLILNQPGGVLLQDLPFEIELKKFHLEHYPNGTPKLFASDVVLHDKKSGAQHTRRIEVNHPATLHGVTIYQSGFDDGGSPLVLHAVPLNGSRSGPELRTRIGEARELTSGTEKLTLELLELRTFNIEPRAALHPASAASAAAAQGGMAGMSAADTHDLGPSLRYRLRDAAGQAREFLNYMQPVDMGEGVRVLLLGVRETPAQPFSYLRLPVDEAGSAQGFVRLLAALHDDDMRQQAAERYAALASASAQARAQLADSAQRALAIFAGRELVQGQALAGLPAISAFIEAAVPEAERGNAAQVLFRLLGGCLHQLNTIAREAENLPPLPADSDATAAFMGQALLALSEAPLYGAPLALTLHSFEPRYASAFQLTRSPGTWLVYPGCLLLVAGVFLMLYVRDRRLWLWLQEDGGGTLVTLAMSARRRSAGSAREFAALRAWLLPAPPAPPPQEKETP